LVNRILLPYLVEAIRLFSEGNSIKSIDKTMLDFGMPMGPLRLLDEIGLDVAAHVALDLEKRVENFKVPQILHEILETKKLGRKTGQGFYIYRHGKPIGSNTPLYKLQKNKKTISQPELQEAMVNAMVAVAAQCLEDQVAITAADVDLAMVMGTGWAPFRGGPLTYLKKTKK